MRYRVVIAGNFGSDNRRIEVDDELELSRSDARDLLNAGMIVEKES